MMKFQSLRWGCLIAVLGLVAGCGAPAPMTKGQQDAAALRQHCQKNPTADPERCMIFLGGP